MTSLPLGNPAAALTELEVKYIEEHRLGRLATASASGEPDVAALGAVWRGDLGVFLIGSLAMEATRKYQNLRRNPRASLVFDDVLMEGGYQPRGVKVTGAAVLYTADSDIKVSAEGLPIIVLAPERKWSWGISEPAFGADMSFTYDINGQGATKLGQ